MHRIEKLLSKLSKDIIKGKGVQDFHMKTRRKLLARLGSLIERLDNQWLDMKETISDSRQRPVKDPVIEREKEIFLDVMRRVNKIITITNALTVATESTYQIDKPIAIANSNIKMNTLTLDKEMLEIIQRYRTLRNNIKDIAESEFARNLSIYLVYFTAAIKGITTAFLAWGDGLSRAAEKTGSIFYPVSATFNTTAASLRLSSCISRWYIAYTKAKKTQKQADKQEELERRENVFFSVLTVTLNGLSFLAFAGILTMPLGWVFVAAAMLMDWVDNGLGGYRRANAGLCAYLSNKKDILFELFGAGYYDEKGCFKLKTVKDISAALEAERAKPPGSPIVKKKIEELQLLLLLQKKVDETKTAAQWRALSVISMILIACGPIPAAGSLLGLAGLVVMGIDVGANIKPYLDPYLEKYLGICKKSEETTEKSVPLFNLHLRRPADPITEAEQNANNCRTPATIPWKLTLLGKKPPTNNRSNRSVEEIVDAVNAGRKNSLLTA